MDRIFFGSGFLVWIICGFLGLGISYGIVQECTGTILALLSLLVAPFLLALAPIYALLSQGNWMPAAIVYGGGVGGIALMAIGSALSGED